MICGYALPCSNVIQLWLAQTDRSDMFLLVDLPPFDLISGRSPSAILDTVRVIMTVLAV